MVMIITLILVLCWIKSFIYVTRPARMDQVGRHTTHKVFIILGSVSNIYFLHVAKFINARLKFHFNMA